MTDQPPQKPTQGRPKKKPYSPGVLMLLGIFLLALAAFCFKDVVYPADAAEEWRKENRHFTIYLNWGVMVAGGLLAVYAFALAAKRSKGGAAGAAPTPPSEPRDTGRPGAGDATPPAPEPSGAESSGGETPGDEPSAAEDARDQDEP